MEIYSHHIAIAGTGRAGTSFLVRYLTALGLDTTLSRCQKEGQTAAWDDNAHAGLEESVAYHVSESVSEINLPYVIKDPWLYESIENVLAHPIIRLKAVIIPIRSLNEAAASRAILERRNIYEKMPWMAEDETYWETWATTPGGVIYSLNPIDQGRLLAVGLHKLIEHLAASDIPMIFLSFPRFMHDADYLYKQLSSILPESVTLEQAREVLGQLVDPKKIRVNDEINPSKEDIKNSDANYSFPSDRKLHQASMSREIRRLHNLLHQSQVELSKLKVNQEEIVTKLEKEKNKPRMKIPLLKMKSRSSDWHLQVRS